VAQLVIAISGAGAIGLLFAVVRALMTDFVVPFMFLRRSNCLAAWRQVWQLIAGNLLNIVLYLLFSLLLTIGIGIAVALVVLATCCLAGCLLAIPYIGTVALLPILIFRRSYSLYYLAQYGSDFDAFTGTIEARTRSDNPAN
jgi:hypothetical protein